MQLQALPAWADLIVRGTDDGVRGCGWSREEAGVCEGVGVPATAAFAEPVCPEADGQHALGIAECRIE